MTQIMKIGPSGVALIWFFESCKLVAYRDSAGVWTIGWGSTGPDIVAGTVWTQAQCNDRFMRDATSFSAQVSRLVAGVPTSQHQFDALVSLAYNVGAKSLAGSTLLARHKAGDYAAARAQFARWNMANGAVLAGLTRRRAAEAGLYGTPDNLPAPKLV